MKLSKSKLALAKVINENGGWAEGAKWAAQDKRGATYKPAIWFYSGNEKPYTAKGCTTWKTDYKIHGADAIQYDKLLPNWHQTCLSSEEYYQAYPKTDADGWIEWSGGECPVEKGTIVDVKYANGVTNFGVSALTSKSDDNHKQGTCVSFLATNWDSCLPVSGIVAYRMHNPDVKPELCESVTRGIPEPEVEAAKSRLAKNLGVNVDVKPTIEQLAQDCRDAKDYADKMSIEFFDASTKAESIKIELRKRISELSDLVG